MNNKPITVLYLIDTYISLPGQALVGGAEKQLYLLASSLDPKIFRPIVVQLNPADLISETSKTSNKMELLNLPTGKIYSLHGLRQLMRLADLQKSEDVHIIHTFFEKSEIMGWVSKHLSSVPIWITSRRDLGFKRKSIHKRIFRIASKACKKCVVNCNAIRNQMIQQKELPEERIEVIYNGIDLEPYQVHDNPKTLKNELNIKDDVFLVGMVATLKFEIKGHRFFVEASKKVLEKFPKVEFVLIGDGPLRNYFENMAEELGVRQNLHFLGKRNDIPRILSSLDISVLCSTSEGFSNVILESMAAGKPVVATDVGGSPEMVIDGLTGYLVPPADSDALAKAVMNLLEDPEKARDMGDEGRKLVQNKFTIGTMVKSYENLYKNLYTELDSQRRINGKM